MIEIRFHGRGGQGSQIACKILATAAFFEGNDVQAFPYFGVERRGAPVTAFTKIDEKGIRNKSMIYQPDYVVVLAESLLSVVDVTNGLKEGGLVIINSSKDPEELGEQLGVRVATVDATQIAIEHNLGSRAQPIVNTAILGAFAKASGIVGMEAVEKGIGEFVPRYTDRNVAAAKAAYEETNGPAGPEGAGAKPEAKVPLRTYMELPPTPINTESSRKVKTGGWKTWKPTLIPEKCIKCYICWKVCPDVSVKVDDPDGGSLPEFDYDFCKGCGLCAHECPKDAIEMKLEVVE